MAQAKPGVENAAKYPKATQRVLVCGVHGNMENPFTHDKFEHAGKGTPLTEIDGWVQSQIDAGKLRVVDQE